MKKLQNEWVRAIICAVLEAGQERVAKLVQKVHDDFIYCVIEHVER